MRYACPMMLNRPAPVDVSRKSWAEESAAWHRTTAQMNFILGALFATNATMLGFLIAKLYF